MTDALRPLDLILIVPGLERLAALAEPWIRKACDYEAEWSVEEIAAGIHEGRFQLWVAWQCADNAVGRPAAVIGAGVTRISLNKRGERIGHDVIFASEDMGRVLPLLDRLEEFFREQGCVRMRISGRKGWARKLPDYRLAAVVLERSL
jgi:hypothetical protein